MIVNDSLTPTTTLKVVILGDSGVGKTCLRSQFVHHIFTNAYKATIGGDYLTTSITIPHKHSTESVGYNHIEHEHEHQQDFSVNNRRIHDKPQKVNLQIWDTAGQERFNSISQAFYRGTDVVILVYDITNYESVLSIRDWFKRFMEHCNVSRPGVVIVGNKIDKNGERCVDIEEIREILKANIDVSVENYVEDWETDLREISCKRLNLVEDLFIRVAEIGVNLIQGDNINRNTVNKRRNIVGFDSIDLHESYNSPVSRCSC